MAYPQLDSYGLNAGTLLSSWRMTVNGFSVSGKRQELNDS